jgi:hypothetical protein
LHHLEILSTGKISVFSGIQMKGSQKSVYENAAECPALWAGMNAAISKTR